MTQAKRKKQHLRTRSPSKPPGPSRPSVVPVAASGPVFLGPLSSPPLKTFRGPPREGYRPPLFPPLAPAPGTFRGTVPSAALGAFLVAVVEAAGVDLAGAGEEACSPSSLHQHCSRWPLRLYIHAPQVFSSPCIFSTTSTTSLYCPPTVM